MKATSANPIAAVILAMLLAILLSSASFGAEHGETEAENTTATHEAELIAEPPGAKSAVPEKAVVCYDARCEGLYEDLVDALDIRNDGFVIVLTTQVLYDALAQSSLGCGRPEYLFIQYASDPFDEKRNAAVGRLINQLLLAKALGSEIMIRWEQSGNSYSDCDIWRIELRN